MDLVLRASSPPCRMVTGITPVTRTREQQVPRIQAKFVNVSARWEECRCGAAFIHTHGGTIGSIADDSGFTPVPNSDCGFEWICPACLPKVKAALNLLREHFGDETSHLHFAGLIMKMEKGEV